jgi:hypothetical protein
VARLFHTLVVCGAGLTLTHCGGGRADTDDGTSPGGQTGTGGTGVGGTSTGGASTGGATTGGSAGTPGTGGAPTGGSGGFGGFGGATGEWTNQSYCEALYCDSVQFEGRQVGAIPLIEPCPIERGRPETPDDCPAGRRFTCALGVADGVARLVNCECLPATDACACPDVAGCIGFNSEACTDEVNICGCAQTCILR